MSGYEKLALALLDLLRAARIHKITPLLILMLNAALLLGDLPDPLACGIAASFVLAVGMLGMELNVLTDAEIDRSVQPHLLARLTRSRSLLRATITIELLAGLLLLISAKTRGGWLLLAGMLGCATASTLYSYNFIAFWNPKKYRLKVFWWSNALSVVGGYFALWVTGFACAEHAWADAPIWLAIALSASLVDYGVFLDECAADAAVERAHALKTLPALLGQRRTSLIGLAVLVSGGAGVLVSLLASLRIHSFRTVAALSFHLGVQAITCARCLGSKRRRESREAILDSSFWVSRLGMLAILAVL
ncbi:hypothetical protein WME99_44385 [Sorangium sp. So ce136]|uniref:hypothetical protein n=1 Tax=Sorangium sp. So ce136 TaxID=3133284 RepID=UPI003F115EA8